jgi:hypothetical protein
MPADRYTLWGWTSRWRGVIRPIPVNQGNMRARAREFHADYPDALTGIYTTGDEPAGLALQVAERLESN